MRSVSLWLLAALACAGDAPDTVADTAPEAEGTADVTEAIPASTAEAAPDPASRAPSEVWLDRYDFDERLWYVDLPGRLDEVSGLAFTEDGRLFAHDDEQGRVHQIDPESGEVGKRFDLGDPAARDDFEGITIVGERFFMVSSAGLLYEFREAGDRVDVEFRVTDTGVGRACEVEGLEYDPSTEALLLVCKTTAPARGPIAIHRIALRPGQSVEPWTIDRAQLAEWDVDRDFAPSGLVLTPVGTALILSARDDAIIEVDASGVVIGAVSLREGRHPQSEGIELAADGMLYVADEKNGKEPRITAYAPSSTEAPSAGEGR